MIGDRDAIAATYIYVAVFLLGAVVGVLVLAERASSTAAMRGRDERRRHAEEVALLDARADRHEQDIRRIIEHLAVYAPALPKPAKPKRKPAKS